MKWVIYDSILDRILAEFPTKEKATKELGENLYYEDTPGLEIREIENDED
jgi:hypothetical protein